MKIIIDQIGRPITLPEKIDRIISLVPSITELLFDLGLENKIVGRTKFCVHPSDLVKEVRIIGGTKNIRLEDIHGLQPDFIIANKEENNKTDIEELEKHFTVWVSDVPNMDASFDMISDLGNILDRSTTAQEIIENSKFSLDLLRLKKSEKALYLIWQNPFMAAGGDTYIHEMMDQLGYENVLENKTRYPQLTIQHIKALRPEVILLSSEPFPFKEKHVKALRTHFPNIKIELVDGELFSWYGSRLIHK